MAPLLTPRRFVTGAGILVAAVAVVSALLAVAAVLPGSPPAARTVVDGEVRILFGRPATLDPAAAGDHGSASVIAQVYEGLTAIDPSVAVRPALAERWDVLEGGRRIVFHLRPGLTFSDGTPLTGGDVVRSWLRLIDPDRPSPLATLMLDVEGAAAFLRGDSRDPSAVGLRADGNAVEVDLVRPATDFPAIVAGPTFAVVPASALPDAVDEAADGFVGSGAYLLEAVDPGEIRLRANPAYWAGPPPIGTVHLIDDIGGRTVVDAFLGGDLDYAAIPSYDAPWVRYDPTLGPALREETSPSVSYFGFDTSRPPFDDVRVRRAFGLAIDWRRLVEISGRQATRLATGLVPPGIPGRSERDFLPAHDPAAARLLLAEAGYPGGAGFPPVTFTSTGGGYAGAILDQLERELDVSVGFEVMEFDPFIRRLEGDDPPAMWTLAWVADYPGANDFLGVLLGTGEANNNARWSSAEFDAAIADALSAVDADDAVAAFERAQEIVRRDVPVVPLAYDAGWTLARDGLLGATNGPLGIPRIAGFAWDGVP